MITLRLPEKLEKRVNQIAVTEKRTKTQIVRQAIENYLHVHDTQKTPYELGEDLFGRHGGGNSRLSTDYKKKLKEKLNAKHAY